MKSGRTVLPKQRDENEDFVLPVQLRTYECYRD